jgi:hypothetical protein
VSLDGDEKAESQLRDRVARVEQRVSILTAVLRLVLALLRISGFRLDLNRVPDAEGKRRPLGAIERARKVMRLTAALRVLGLSVTRYHDRVGRQEGCSLDDHSSCLRSKPQRLTHQEVGTIGDMVQTEAVPVYVDSGARVARSARRQSLRSSRHLGEADSR